MHVFYTNTCFGHTLAPPAPKKFQPPSVPNNVMVGASTIAHGATHRGDSSTAEGKIKKITSTGTSGEALTK